MYKVLANSPALFCWGGKGKCGSRSSSGSRTVPHRDRQEAQRRAKLFWVKPNLKCGSHKATKATKKNLNSFLGKKPKFKGGSHRELVYTSPWSATRFLVFTCFSAVIGLVAHSLLCIAVTKLHYISKCTPYCRIHLFTASSSGLWLSMHSSRSSGCSARQSMSVCSG